MTEAFLVVILKSFPAQDVDTSERVNWITAEATNRAGHCKSLYEQRLLGTY